MSPSFKGPPNTPSASRRYGDSRNRRGKWLVRQYDSEPDTNADTLFTLDEASSLTPLQEQNFFVRHKYVNRPRTCYTCGDTFEQSSAPPPNDAHFCTDYCARHYKDD